MPNPRAAPAPARSSASISILRHSVARAYVDAYVDRTGLARGADAELSRYNFFRSLRFCRASSGACATALRPARMRLPKRRWWSNGGSRLALAARRRLTSRPLLLTSPLRGRSNCTGQTGAIRVGEAENAAQSAPLPIPPLKGEEELEAPAVPLATSERSNANPQRQWRCARRRWRARAGAYCDLEAFDEIGVKPSRLRAARSARRSVRPMRPA